MKKNTILVILLAFLSMIAGWLLSGISWVGRTGINLVYKEYKFLKVWWKGAMIIFVIWMFLLLVQSLLSKRGNNGSAGWVNIVLLLLGILGLCYCYYDFTHAISHKLLGEKFHLGVYLFWLGWIGISVFLMLDNKRKVVEANTPTSSNISL